MESTLKIRCLLSPIICAFIPFTTTGSVDVDYFIGLKGGYQQTSDSTYHDSPPRGSFAGLFGEVVSNNAWGIDIGYQYHHELRAETTNISVDTHLVESAVRYYWYLSSDFSMYGRLGASYWNTEKNTPSRLLNVNGWSPIGEVGGQYRLMSNIILSAGYQYIDAIGNADTGTYDSHSIVFGGKYHFGGN